MANDISAVFRQINDTIVDLKRILEQVNDLRGKCWVMSFLFFNNWICLNLFVGYSTVECASRMVLLLASYQSLPVIVLDALRQANNTPSGANDEAMDQ